MTRTSSSCLPAVVLMLAVLSTAALATDSKPDIALKAKYTEVTVSFDDAIKSDAPLLKYLTAAGKSWASKTLKELVEQRKDMTDVPADIRNRPWSAERSYTQEALVANRYASVIRGEFSYTGGAHPNHCLLYTSPSPRDS